MLSLCRELLMLPEMNDLLARIATAESTPVAVGGLSHAHKAHMIATVRLITGRPILVLCADENEAVRMSADLTGWTQDKPHLLPVREWSFYHAEAVSREWEHVRLATLAALASGQSSIVCAPVDAFLQRTMPKDVLKRSSLSLKPGQFMAPDDLVSSLVSAGYRHCDQVEGIGQFARRGGIVDFFSPGQLHPVRVDFFGDEIDSLAAVDTDTQRRLETMDAAALLPVSETLPQAAQGGIEGLIAAMLAMAERSKSRKGTPEKLALTIQNDAELLRDLGMLPSIDRYLPLIYPDLITAFDMLPPDTIVFTSEYSRLQERTKNALWRWGQDLEPLLADGMLSPEMTQFFLDEGSLSVKLSHFSTVYMDTFLPGCYDLPPRAVHNLPVKQLASFGGHIDVALEDISHYREENYALVVLSSSERQAERLVALLADHGITALLDFGLSAPPVPGQISVGLGTLSAGLEYPALKLCIMTEGQLLATPRRHTRRADKKDPRARLASYTDLTQGDLVVHEHHGIGRFTGIVKMTVDNTERDYVHIAYAGSDGLYVPVTQLHLVSKYIGAGEDISVRLNKLGGGDWQKARIRARAAVKDLAGELIKLYAERQHQPGHSFPPDCDMQRQFESSFVYVETEDQLRCASEIKDDMQASAPMDRLLCGDVGFGKTEVALRAVMKCILGGRQAAILVPTTVLAQQHYQTALRRFADCPVSIAMCSRFVPARELKKNMAAIADGTVDLVIGTHKLLQKSMVFHNLGLLIVDEEQRFGVTHKERLKELAKQVDVLSLTATPIPRTLNMALSGIRDMSTIEEPPRDRYPVQTYVLEHDYTILTDALRREVQRGGQAYYLHNRVESIDREAARLAGMLPGVSIAVAHGQMGEEALSDIMRRMSEGDIQVLVCTTIIETGLDIPNVNTLIIEDADRLGLAQLHQIRGRVGRSPRHAFAYMTFRKGKSLTEVAAKRLSAIREYAEFGSGFKIAMRDLEIRGAGNVLGPEQHGHMMSVGYDMYLSLLEEAVLEAKGEPPRKSVDCTADIAVAAGIPEGYVASPGQRMDLYRRIASIRTDDDASDVTDELIDRYGDPPASVTALLQIALLRADASNAGISDIAQKQSRLICRLADPDIRRVSLLCAHPDYKGRVLFSAGDMPHLSFRLTGHAPILDEARTFVAAYGSVAD